LRSVKKRLPKLLKKTDVMQTIVRTMRIVFKSYGKSKSLFEVTDPVVEEGVTV